MLIFKDTFLSDSREILVLYCGQGELPFFDPRFIWIANNMAPDESESN